MRFASRGLLLAGLLVLTLLVSWATSQPSLASSDTYEEFFDLQLFHERVKLLNCVALGTTQVEVLRALGEPRNREAGP